MKISNLVDGVKENEELWKEFFFVIKVFKNRGDDIFVHLLFGVDYFIVILYSFEGYLFRAQLILDHLVDIEFNHVLRVFLIKLQELLFHCRRAGDNIRPVFCTNFQYFSKRLFFLFVDIVDLINRDEFTLVKLQIPPLISVKERFRHGYNDITVLMHLFVHSSDFKLQFLRFFDISELLKVF